eukprot:TRINITY_DN2118_c1_g1_i1.p1 TRINITY_DN2118_c1_g1~~TRINITY_DN2118_c1_g1_i1.p1  ORF type:complete len:204 (-),score=28.25 TRINITY_DN2118_c1_g1_i1:247-858(-)
MLASQPAIHLTLPRSVFGRDSTISPLQAQPFSIDSADHISLIQNFLEKFFGLADVDRSALVDAYCDDSFFSMTSEASRPPPQSGRNNTKPDDVLKNYTPYCRKLKKQEERGKALVYGPAAIIQMVQILPKTVHCNLTEMKVDAHAVSTQPILMCVQVDGHFLEIETSQTRMFQRTLLLTPTAPDSKSTTSRSHPTVHQNRPHP